jgi:hypothetical protein
MRIRLLPVSVLCLVALAAYRGSAAPQSPAAVSTLPSPAAEGSAQPNLVTDSRGTVWMSWLEPRPGGGHRFQIARLNGNAWTAPITVVEGANFFVNWADFPSLFIAADGTMAAHWLERTTGRTAYFVRVKLSKDRGQSWSDPITPHRDQSATEHGFVSFFDAPGGGVGLVWLDGRDMAGGSHAAGGHGSGSMTLRSTIIRNSEPGPEMVIDSRVCDCCQTSAARTADAVLVAYRDRSDKDIRDTSVARFTPKSGGEGWSAPVTVHADGWEITGCPVNGPVVTAAGDAAAVAWFTGVKNTPRTLVAFSADGGRTFAPPIQANAGVTLGRIGMLMLDANRVLISSLERGDTGARLLLREVSRDGRAAAPIEIAKATPERSGGFARIVRSGGRVMIAWTDMTAGPPSRIKVATLEAR